MLRLKSNIDVLKTSDNIHAGFYNPRAFLVIYYFQKLPADKKRGVFRALVEMVESS